jgi:hypothetical protein
MDTVSGFASVKPRHRSADTVGVEARKEAATSTSFKTSSSVLSSEVAIEETKSCVWKSRKCPFGRPGNLVSGYRSLARDDHTLRYPASPLSPA